MSGRVQGFGRILSQNKIAKYINSPESEIYNKSKALYGILSLNKALIENDVCYLVEVIPMSYRCINRITNVVSSSGTALTVNQIRTIV